MDMKRVRSAIIVAAVLLAAAAFVKLARHSGFFDADTAARITQAILGLTFAFYANFIPKRLGRARSAEAGRRVQAALRLSGWAFALAGLAYAALALFAPPTVAWSGSIVVMGAAIATSLVSAVWCFGTRRAAGSGLE
jgi:hypothetical protein